MNFGAGDSVARTGGTRWRQIKYEAPPTARMAGTSRRGNQIFTRARAIGPLYQEPSSIPRDGNARVGGILAWRPARVPVKSSGCDEGVARARLAAQGSAFRRTGWSIFGVRPTRRLARILASGLTPSGPIH